MTTSAGIPLWPDNPTADDLLGFRDVATPIIDAVNRDRLDPVAIGISGDWGSGKTTILEIIQAELQNDESVVVVYTRPWEYDPATDPKATLIAEVLAEVERRVTEASDGSLSAELKDKFVSLAKRVKWSKAITLAASSALTLSPPKFEEVIDIFGKEDKPAGDPTLQGFRTEYAALIGDLKSIRRVVVLVDDLDRCLPEAVIGALEAIKLFLSVQKMGFVIAADERLVTYAIGTRYKGATHAERMARQYLEKIVQIPIRVPALGESDTEAYLTLLLVHRHVEADEVSGDGATRFERIAEHCANQRANSASRVLDDLPPDLIPEEAQIEVALAKQLAPALAVPLAGNPRRLKRFLNAYWLRSDIAARRNAELEAPALAKLLVLEQLEPEQFDLLLTWFDSDTLRERLGRMEEAETDEDLDVAEKPLYRWARSSPKLANKDLGPYLRLAASLKSLPGGASDLRSELQGLLERLTGDSAAIRREAQEEATGHSDADKIELVKEAVRLIQASRGDQDDIAESLAALADSPVVAKELAGALQGLDASSVEASLIIRLGGLSDVKPVIKEWVTSDRLDEMARAAGEDALKPSPT